jgi:hypothetical protein
VAAWKLPFVVAAIAAPITLAFLAGGPGVGVAIGALVAVGIVFVAVRERPRGAIGEAPQGAAQRLLVVVTAPVEDAASVGAIAAAAQRGGESGAVMVLAPARIGFLQRWASDLERARHEAQQNLVISVASLAKAGVAAEARVGDEDLVQAVEDTVPAFGATELILVTAADEDDPGAAAAASELEARLRTPFLRLVSDRAAR